MPNGREKNYEEWLRKADEDELSAKAVLKEGAPSTACFLAQQIAEKYLKGLLVFHGKEFPKMHDLLGLETLLLDVEPEIKEYDSDLDQLSTYYIETRYPGDFPEFTLEECSKALEAATRIKEFVLDKIKQADS